MASLVEYVEMRDAVDKLCAGIDAGAIPVDEQKLFVLCTLIRDKFRNNALFRQASTDMLFKIASRCPSGSAAIKAMAQ